MAAADPFENFITRHEFTASMSEVRTKLGVIHEDVVETRDFAKQTNGRVRKLETWQAFVQGGAATKSLAVNALLALVTALVGAVAGHFLL